MRPPRAGPFFLTRAAGPYELPEKMLALLPRHSSLFLVVQKTVHSASAEGAPSSCWECLRPSLGLGAELGVFESADESALPAAEKARILTEVTSITDIEVKEGARLRPLRGLYDDD